MFLINLSKKKKIPEINSILWNQRWKRFKYLSREYEYELIHFLGMTTHIIISSIFQKKCFR